MQPIPTYILSDAAGEHARLEPAPFTAYSLPEAVAHEPTGVYTVARTFKGDHALLLDAHLDRLEQSAQLVGIPLALDRARLRAALRDLLHQAGFPDAKFRITVPQSDPGQIYLSLEPLVPVPAEVLQQGAHVITSPFVRPDPVAKRTDWMDMRRPVQEKLGNGVYEAVLVSAEGRLLEGLSTNFYGVLAGELRTAGSGILEGITRKAVLQIAPEVVPVRLDALHRDDVPHLTEAFLTSSGRGVVPVVQVDDVVIGDGSVGPLTRAIGERYDTWTLTHSEPI